jgi:hypothetical protein
MWRIALSWTGEETKKTFCDGTLVSMSIQISRCSPAVASCTLWWVVTIASHVMISTSIDGHSSFFKHGLWALRSAKFQPHPSSSSCYYYYIRKQKAENKLEGSDMVGFEY